MKGIPYDLMMIVRRIKFEDGERIEEEWDGLSEEEWDECMDEVREILEEVEEEKDE